MISVLMSIAYKSLLITGDFNCPGQTQCTVDDDLLGVFSSFGLTQLVKVSTREKNILDLLACSSDLLSICTLSVDDAGCISDHRMIIATLSVSWRQHQKVNFTFRRTKSVDSESFEQALYASSLFTAPKTSNDEFADQLADIVTAELDKVAPLHHATRSSHGRKINEFLSDTAKQAKRHRRRCERRWKRTGQETDRVAYRSACKTANRLINESRSDYFASRMDELVSDTKRRWAAVKELLREDDRQPDRTAEESKSFCLAASSFFTSKLDRIKKSIGAQLAGSSYDPTAFDVPHTGSRLMTIQPVTANDIAKIIKSMPAKSSPLNFVPTSLLKSCSGVLPN